MTTANWKNDLISALRNVAVEPTGPVHADDDRALIPALRVAGNLFAARRDSFAEGKAATCADLAAKLEKYGSFASDRQRDFALKLVEWSKPRAAAPATGTVTADGLMVPKLFTVMQRLADLTLPVLKIARRNQDSLCWIIVNDKAVGKIENARVTLFTSRLGADVERITQYLVELEKNPLEIIKQAGRASGRCACCSRDLTDPVSIEFGVGPVCRAKLA